MKLKDDTKIEALVTATIDLVFDQGLAGITISKVAKRAKVATGTVYVYFNSKEELLTYVFTTLKKQSLKTTTEDLDFNKPFLPTMKKLWLNYFHYCLENEKENVFMEQFKYSPFIHNMKIEWLEEFEKPIAAFLEVGKQELLIKNEDNSLLYGALLGITREMVKVIHEGLLELNDITRDKMFKMVWDSIKS